MANAIYPKGKEGIANQDIAFLTDTIKCELVDTALYTYSATHQFLSDVPVGARISTSAALTGKTVTNGQFDASDPVFTTPSVGTYEALVFFVDSGVEGTSELLCYIDTATGLPITTTGVDVTVTVGSYIFAI